MPRYVAFLRAINVGGHIVKMERLRRLFQSLGFTEIETFIASGNVIFRSAVRDRPRLEQQIEAFLQEQLGYAVKTFIRTDAEVAEIAGYEPFGISASAGGTTVFIGLLQSEPTPEKRDRLINAGTASDEFHLNGRELYWLRRGASSESEFSGAKLEKTLGLATTIRNMNTLRRLAAKYPPRTG